ncbi:glycosyltransferase family A protein [Ruegeria sp. HKCCE3926]|uniref:glycosyltransferase family 2 protein n=1 Tax=Ruegeria sp. HKCCE3926 TaxID=2794831 RepID=UPI001AE4594C|nr:glycosyltransferase family A protein [Ruegeria sp. HKCCE3926]
MTDQPHVSAIVTAHREGLMAGPAARSLLAAVADAEKADISCEIIVVLDIADDLTRDVLNGALGERAKYVESATGDPGLARNTGIAAATGEHACFLDADDLWSENWISAAIAAARKRPDAIHHSACNMVFGFQRLMFWHMDSESDGFDKSYLDWSNYWDSLSLAKTQIYRDTPFEANELSKGFGHEDWHWNAITIAKGIPHKPVAGTMHFKRARTDSQMSKVDSVGGIRAPLGDGEILRLQDSWT